MKRTTTASSTADVLVSLLRRHDNWKHLTAQQRGRSLVVLTADDEAESLARLEPLDQDGWGLSIRWHDNKLQRLPVAGTLEQIVQVLREDFAALLAPLDPD
jgi:hypothetical protein